MRKIKILFLLMMIIFYTTGCTSSSTDSTEKIVAPQNRDIPIQGTWKIEKVLDKKTTTDPEEVDEWLDKTIEFSPHHMMIDSYFLVDPHYKVKKVDGQQYLLYNHKSFPEDFHFPLDVIDIITITDGDKFLCEVFKGEDEGLIIEIYNHSFYLKKISDETTYSLSEQESKKNTRNLMLKSSQGDDLIHSGVFIGLRSPDPKKEGNYHYRTLWIAAQNRELHPILEIEDIFFPRRSGFWKLEVEEWLEDDRKESLLFAYNILSDESSIMLELITDPLKSEDKVGSVIRYIDYVGNDYVSIREQGKGSFKEKGGSWEEDKLRIVPIDSLPIIRGVKASDILGKLGVESIEMARQEIIDEKQLNNIQILNAEDWDENFGMERKMGHWFLRGSVSYEEEGKTFYQDYNINMLPPSKLVFYDDLSIPWTEIKDKVPEAVDAYTSPNKDIALIFTKTELLIYNIEQRQLGEVPLEKVTLKKGETVIMAEWATGHYVENWEKAVLPFARH